jgi:aminocarboxymuconate-semialdehyde decarboxylase
MIDDFIILSNDSMGMYPSQIVDVHVHLTPHRFSRVALTGRKWYGMTSDDGELDNPKNLWTTEHRIDEMNRIGLDTQLVSPTDVFYQYDKDPEVTAQIAVECNEEISELTKDYPSRFKGLGTLPMQDIELTLLEMKHCIKTLGLDGFMIDDHVNGVTYDDAYFEPFWEKVEQYNAFILIHQYGPTVTVSRTRKYFLHNTVGNLVDRTLTYGCLVGGGVMDSYPELKICLGHAGGYVPFAVDRMDKGWEMFPKYRGKALNPPSSYLNKFYYDTATFTDRNLRFLIDSVGSDRVILGSDWPAPMAVEDPVNRIKHAKVLNSDEKEAILRGNLTKILKK